VNYKLLNTILEDDDTPYGGTACDRETLKYFLDDIGMPYDTPIEDINKALKECGIKEIKL